MGIGHDRGHVLWFTYAHTTWVKSRSLVEYQVKLGIDLFCLVMKLFRADAVRARVGFWLSDCNIPRAGESAVVQPTPPKP